MEQQYSDIIEGPWSLNPDQADISYKWVVKIPDIQLIEEGIPILDFATQTIKRNLEMEFRLIRKITESQYHNDQLKNFDSRLNRFNRYNTILPYKQTEVQIPESVDDEGTPYINASYINSPLLSVGLRKFIATQGPLPETFQHFWLMAWNEGVACIFMLCNLKENQKVQCDQYWPSSVGSTTEYGQISVTFQSEDILYNSLYKRTLLITRKEFPDELREVYQYQWSEWRDHGVPEESGLEVVEELVELMVAEHNQSRTSIVHCSAGVGRTGTLISLVNLILNLRYHLPAIQHTFTNGNISNDEKKNQVQNCTISVFGIVRRLREQRWGMVHHAEQYGYLHKYLNTTIEKELRRIGVSLDSQDPNRL